jgi:integration host factor subunit alpha
VSGQKRSDDLSSDDGCIGCRVHYLIEKQRRTIMSMNKIDITESIREKFGMPKKECVKIVESLFDIIKADLNNGNDVMISGFGKWTVKAKKERKGRNPKTGKAMTINARKVVTFKPSNVLRKVFAK